MSENKFEIQDAFSFGWETFKENVGFFIILVILIMVISAIPQIISIAGEDSTLLSLIGAVLSVVVGVVLQMGIIKMMLKVVDGEIPQYSELWSNTSQFITFFVTSLVVGIMVFFGLLFLIVPGIILAIMFQYATYTIIDKNYDIGESLSASQRITKGSKFHLFLFGISLMLLNIVGILALFVGLLVTIPITMVSTAWVYRQLERQNDRQAIEKPLDNIQQ